MGGEKKLLIICPDTQWSPVASELISTYQDDNAATLGAYFHLWSECSEATISSVSRKNKNQHHPHKQNTPALRVQGNGVPHGEGRSSSAPGFPSEEGGTRRGAPRSPCARSAVCYFDADPWKLMVRGFIKWGHSSYRMNSRPTDSPHCGIPT